MMLGKNQDKVFLPGLSPKNMQSYDNLNCNFIKNSKRAKSIMLANQRRKQAFVHQTHLKQVFKKKQKETLNLLQNKKNYKIKSQQRSYSPQYVQVGSNGSVQKCNKKYKSNKKMCLVNNSDIDLRQIKSIQVSKKLKLIQENNDKNYSFYPKIKKYKIHSYKEINKIGQQIKSIIDQRQTQDLSKRIKNKIKSNQQFQQKHKLDQESLQGWTYKIKADQTSYGFNIK